MNISVRKAFLLTLLLGVALLSPGIIFSSSVEAAESDSNSKHTEGKKIANPIHNWKPLLGPTAFEESLKNNGINPSDILRPMDTQKKPDDVEKFLKLYLGTPRRVLWKDTTQYHSFIKDCLNLNLKNILQDFCSIRPAA